MYIHNLNNKLLIMVTIVILAVSILGIAEAQDKWSSERFIDIRNVRERTWKVEGFEIDEEMTLTVKARGGGWKGDWHAKAWILNANTREVFWEMDWDNTDPGVSRRDRVFEKNLSFPIGAYEVYFATNPVSSVHVEDLSDLVEGLVKGFKYKPKYSKHWGISLEPVNGQADLDKIYRFQPADDEQAVVQMISVGNDEHLKKGFTLNRPMDLQIYMLGEGRRSSREMYDYGWIINADTREREWTAEVRRSEHAGGASKNRQFDDIITLSAGNYIVYYVTDDSHSAEEFNMMPPYDPLHWGITIWAIDSDMEDAFITEYEEEYKKPIVEITRVGEDIVENQGFELTQPSELRVFSIGELGSSGMCDYGWIVNARTREIVWEMTKRNTEHAGGGRKNRVADEVIELPKGVYLAYYTTDSGHSYDNWNTSPPFAPDAYGITIWGVGEDGDSESIKTYHEDDDEFVLASLIRMRDDTQRHKSFSLPQRTKVWIYAIGEGSGNKMHDFGWIEDIDGNEVWRMRYQDTSHAGGAHKNRLFSSSIILDRGKYEVHFRTDDSHAFDNWNATKPYDPVHWGITVSTDETEEHY
jgi:hypothetical protein